LNKQWKTFRTFIKNCWQPSTDLIADIAELEGDILILGVGGKMGPSLANWRRQAVDLAGVKKRIIGVSRFSEPGLAGGIETARE